MNIDYGNMTGVEELPSDYFQLREDTLEIAFGSDEFTYEDAGTNTYKGFEEFSAFGECEFSLESDGIYF